jgi:L-ascorbate metabolism protein UlaG (beta-lactamase superfamily)
MIQCKKIKEEYMLDNIEVLYHSSIKINKEKTIYIDPFKIDKNYNDADIIFITHDHYDHYSEEDIDKVINENTTIIIPEELLTKLLRKGINKNAIITVKPNEKYMVQEIKFGTVPAYNTNKTFHPKENDWIGYIITLDGIRYYIAGDTDITEENRKVKCDVAFVPVGGTYTMDFKEAAQLINEIQPKIAVPIHYGSIVGTEQDATDFIKLLHPSIKGIILMKQ